MGNIRVARKIYWKQTAATLIENDFNTFQEIQHGGRQGCVTYSDIFYLFTQRYHSYTRYSIRRINV